MTNGIETKEVNVEEDVEEGRTVEGQPDWNKPLAESERPRFNRLTLCKVLQAKWNNSGKKTVSKKVKRGNETVEERLPDDEQYMAYWLAIELEEVSNPKNVFWVTCGTMREYQDGLWVSQGVRKSKLAKLKDELEKFLGEDVHLNSLHKKIEGLLCQVKSVDSDMSPVGFVNEIAQFEG